MDSIPLCRTRAGPRDPAWPQRLKEEYIALIEYAKQNKEKDEDWFLLESNKTGTKWFVTYPETAPEITIPELDGKTPKMYRGGKICTSDHFKPLWAKNVPRYGIAHAMALGLSPWLIVEIPDLISKGAVVHMDKEKDKATSSSS